MKAFDESKINYDKNYDNSQSYSEEFKKHMSIVFKKIKKYLQKNSKIVEVEWSRTLYRFNCKK